jgi:SPP1 family predicted phage head-tail adaptor
MKDHMRDPGRLRRPLALEAPTETADGSGGVTRSFATVATVFAQIDALSLEEQVRTERLGPRVSHRIVIRRRAGLTATHRLRTASRVFRILAIADADAAGRFLSLACAEEL